MQLEATEKLVETILIERETSEVELKNHIQLIQDEKLLM
jgi:hypothetical protein